MLRLAKNSISNNVGDVKHSLSARRHALKEECDKRPPTAYWSRLPLPSRLWLTPPTLSETPDFNS